MVILQHRKTLHHAYASCDSFNVELIVVDIHGCNDTIENTVSGSLFT